mgnify:CR=1 FL=1
MIAAPAPTAKAWLGCGATPAEGWAAGCAASGHELTWQVVRQQRPAASQAAVLVPLTQWKWLWYLTLARWTVVLAAAGAATSRPRWRVCGTMPWQNLDLWSHP